MKERKFTINLGKLRGAAGNSWVEHRSLQSCVLFILSSSVVNVIISEFVTLLVVPFWLRCFQSCVRVLNEKCGINVKN